MHLLYCDESNLEESEDHFFVYGGVAVSSDSVFELSQRIDELKADAGVAPDFLLKFNPRPKHLTHEEFIALKQSVIEAASKFDCILFTSSILHNIASNPNDARLKEINRICFHFHCFLQRADTSGLVMVDRFEDGRVDIHLREKFANGLRDMPYGNQMRLDRIVGFHYAAIGQSNMCSLIDILLGSYRFVVNAVVDDRHLDAARRISELLSPLFFRERGRRSVSEIGLFFSPKVIRVARYREIYQRVQDFLGDCGVDCEQRIRGEV